MSSTVLESEAILHKEHVHGYHKPYTQVKSFGVTVIPYVWQVNMKNKYMAVLHTMEGSNKITFWEGSLLIETILLCRHEKQKQPQ